MKARIYAFDEVDRPEEIALALTDLRQEIVNEVGALREELSGCVRRKPEKSERKHKGFVMKNVLLSIAVIGIVLGFGMVVQAQYQKGDMSYNVASNPESMSRYLEDVLNSGYFEFTPMTTPTGNDIVEGKMYYDEGGGFYFSDDGATWTQFATAAGNSLDGAYNAGSLVIVDTGVVELQVANSAGVAALLIDYDDAATNAMDAMQITNAGDDAAAVSIQIDGTAGYDIQGTSDTWNVTIAGVANLVGLVTTTGDVTFTGTLYDIIHDASADQLEFQDSAELSFGTDDDISIVFDNAGDDLNITGDESEIAIGADGAGLDMFWHFETASNWLKVSEQNDQLEFELIDLHLSSDSQIEFENDGGTVDWTIDNATDETLLIYPSQTTDDQSVNFGTANNTTDVAIFGVSASTAVFTSLSDALVFNAYDITMNDGDFINFGDSKDFTVTSDSTAVLKIATLATDESPIIHIGANTSGSDVKFYPATTAEYMLWDAGNEALEFVGGQIHLDDTSILQFGSGKDMTVYSDTANTLEFDPSAAGDTIKFGTANTDAVDIIWYSDSSGDTVTFNEEDIGVEFEDVVLQMMDDTTLNFGDDDDVTLMYDETTDDNFEILAASVGVSVTTNDFLVTTDGAGVDAINLASSAGGLTVSTVAGATGDIILGAGDDLLANVTDDMTLTVGGDLTLAVTGTFKMGNALVSNNRLTTVVDIDNITLTEAQSGAVVVMTQTGAAGTVTLPAATSGNIGMWFIIIDGNITGARDLVIDPEGTGTINGDGAGHSITSVTDRDGSGIMIFSTAADTWYTMACDSSTVWTEE